MRGRHLPHWSSVLVHYEASCTFDWFILLCLIAWFVTGNCIQCWYIRQYVFKSLFYCNHTWNIQWTGTSFDRTLRNASILSSIFFTFIVSIICSHNNFITSRQQNWGKVMFSQVSVCHSVWGSPHVTITLDALDLTVQVPLALFPSPSDIWPGTPWPHPKPCPLWVTTGCHHWRPVQTCSFEDLPWEWLLMVATEACTVSKWAVHILL